MKHGRPAITWLFQLPGEHYIGRLGNLVGLWEGPRAGNLVGLWEGPRAGNLVGFWEGTRAGTLVGVGKRVGNLVGLGLIIGAEEESNACVRLIALD